MFQRFYAERADNAKSGKVLFFDQSIHEKLNRSLTIGKKKYDCSFLTDNSEEIQETFVAPPPSAFGLPEGITYKVQGDSICLSQDGVWLTQICSTIIFPS